MQKEFGEVDQSGQRVRNAENVNQYDFELGGSVEGVLLNRYEPSRTAYRR